MAGFVPKDKMSKKAQKELNRQRRTMWDFSPVTKTVESRKRYNRKKNAHDRYDDSGVSVFHYHRDEDACRSSGAGTGESKVRGCLSAMLCKVLTKQIYMIKYNCIK